MDRNNGPRFPTALNDRKKDETVVWVSSFRVLLITGTQSAESSVASAASLTSSSVFFFLGARP